ncbi:MAG: NADH-quinone oxidoreductase subunit J [Fulvivirga sp.]
MEMLEVMFYIICALACISAGFILFTKNILYAAFALVVTLLCIAALYIFSNAEFIAVSQIMIYVGGIIVLIIFGIMLTAKIRDEKAVVGSHNRFLALVSAASVFVMLISVIGTINFTQYQTITGSNLHKIGEGIMTDYLLPFELMAVLLLVALIGATAIASKKEGGTS